MYPKIDLTATFIPLKYSADGLMIMSQTTLNVRIIVPDRKIIILDGGR
jgi:hypothetical protein